MAIVPNHFRKARRMQSAVTKSRRKMAQTGAKEGTGTTNVEPAANKSEICQGLDMGHDAARERR